MATWINSEWPFIICQDVQGLSTSGQLFRGGYDGLLA